MKAFDLLEQAVLLAGGTTPDELLRKTGVSIINTVLTDLSVAPITTLGDELNFSHQGYFTVAMSGVAMLLSVMWGDDAGASSFCEVYNSSRSRLLKKISERKATHFGGDGNENF